MSKKIYVGGLPYNITDKQLEDLFSKFGEVLSAAIVIDKFTKNSKGFGFVEMKEGKDAKKAITELNSTEIEGRKITVNEAKPREERPHFGHSNDRSNGAYHRNNRGGYRRN